MKNYNMILIEKLQKHQLHHLQRLVNVSIKKVKKSCHLIKVE